MSRLWNTIYTHLDNWFLILKLEPRPHLYWIRMSWNTLLFYISYILPLCICAGRYLVLFYYLSTMNVELQSRDLLPSCDCIFINKKKFFVRCLTVMNINPRSLLRRRYICLSMTPSIGFSCTVTGMPRYYRYF